MKGQLTGDSVPKKSLKGISIRWIDKKGTIKGRVASTKKDKVIGKLSKPRKAGMAYYVNKDGKVVMKKLKNY